jgi:ABC-2 type transport system ATP-binding protein
MHLDVDTDALDAVVAHLAGSGVRALTSAPPTLEELFLRHYGDELTDNGVTGAPEAVRS